VAQPHLEDGGIVDRRMSARLENAPVDFAREPGPGPAIVGILCDSGARYASKQYKAEFMRSKQGATGQRLGKRRRFAAACAIPARRRRRRRPGFRPRRIGSNTNSWRRSNLSKRNSPGPRRRQGRKDAAHLRPLLAALGVAGFAQGGESDSQG